MKNGFFKKLSQGFAAVMVVVAAQAAHSEGLLVASSSSNDFSSLVASGRAVLKTNDLQNLLQDSGEKVDATSKPASMSFLMDLSSTDQTRLANMIEKISGERSLLEKKLQKEADKKIASIRNRRHDIQARRLSSFGSSEQKLSKQLFETILEEANVASEMKKELENFDNSHLVHLDFVEFKGMRVVQAISLGSNQLWTVQKTFKVAQAR